MKHKATAIAVLREFREMVFLLSSSPTPPISRSNAIMDWRKFSFATYRLTKLPASPRTTTETRGTRTASNLRFLPTAAGSPFPQGQPTLSQTDALGGINRFSCATGLKEKQPVPPLASKR